MRLRAEASGEGQVGTTLRWLATVALWFFFIFFLAGNDLPPLQIQFRVWWSVYKLLFRGSS